MDWIVWVESIFVNLCVNYFVLVIVEVGNVNGNVKRNRRYVIIY